MLTLKPLIICAKVERVGERSKEELCGGVGEGRGEMSN